MLTRQSLLHELQDRWEAQKCKSVPSKKLHFDREMYNMVPMSDLILSHSKTAKGKRIFVDAETSYRWQEMPWYVNLFHNPARNIKLLLLDTDFSSLAVSSSEIIVPRKKAKGIIKIEDVRSGSFNFHDFNLLGQWKHFLADAWPFAIYPKCRRN